MRNVNDFSSLFLSYFFFHNTGRDLPRQRALKPHRVEQRSLQNGECLLLFPKRGTGTAQRPMRCPPSCGGRLSKGLPLLSPPSQTNHETLFAGGVFIS